jgi:hypothetical protein
LLPTWESTAERTIWLSRNEATATRSDKAVKVNSARVVHRKTSETSTPHRQAALTLKAKNPNPRALAAVLGKLEVVGIVGTVIAR